MKQKKFAQACDKLRESQNLDPGGGTLLNLGICYRYEGRTATAYTVLTQALALAREHARADRVATAERHLGELTNILSRLTIHLADGVDAAQIEIRVDDAVFARETLDQAFAIDPGVHEVQASQKGSITWSTRITVAPVADDRFVEIPVLEPEAPPPIQPEAKPAPLVVPPPPPLEPRPRPELLPKPSEPTHNTRWLGYSLGGLGVAALGVGSYFGIRALVLRARSDKHFDGRYCTVQTCVDDWNSAKTASGVSNVAFVVGAVSLGAGGYFLLRPLPIEAPRRSVTIGARLGANGIWAAATGDF
jgi:tetratricopeptide (TPR) repeat protein